MSKITIKEPHGPYQAVLDTDAMAVTVRECFLGMRFVSQSGETLTVSMRDDGFELTYWDGIVRGEDASKKITCQNGAVKTK